MPLAYDTVGPSASGASHNAASPLTWSHTVTGTDDCLLVGVACDTDSVTISSVTYGSQTMTPLWAGAANYKHSGGQSVGWLAVFKLPAANAGTATVTVNHSAPAPVEAGSLSFTEADPVNGCGAPQYAVGNAAPTLTYTGSTAGNILAAFLVNGSFINSATAPQTSRFINNHGGSAAGGHCAGATQASPGGDATCAWTADADWWAIIAVEVLAATGKVVNAGDAAGSGAAPGPAIETSNMTSGPRDASAAADLGGGAGDWATPQYAAGGP